MQKQYINDGSFLVSNSGYCKSVDRAMQGITNAIIVSHHVA